MEQERELTHTFPLSHEDVEDEWVASSLDLFRPIIKTAGRVRLCGTSTLQQLNQPIRLDATHAVVEYDN